MRSTTTVSALFVVAAIVPVFAAPAAILDKKSPRVKATSVPLAPAMAAKRWTPPPIPSCWWTRSCKRQVMQSEMREVMGGGLEQELITPEEESGTLGQLPHPLQRDVTSDQRAGEQEGVITGNIKRDVESDALSLVNAALSRGIITQAEASALTDMINSNTDPSQLQNLLSTLTSQLSDLGATPTTKRDTTDVTVTTVEGLINQAVQAGSITQDEGTALIALLPTYMPPELQ